MNKVKIFTIHDVKAGIYNKPFYLINEQIAERAAIELLSDPNTDMAKYPDDYTMCYLGVFDDSKGTFELDGLPTPMFRFADLLSLVEQRKSQLAALQEAPLVTEAIEANGGARQ